ncbi:hypothetical protein BN128_45 [Cronobacter sakazakii 696]|nr:hypothetical protein BN128_45 [Cronobacter sakazakii 696]
MLITEMSCGTRSPAFCNAFTAPAAIKSIGENAARYLFD